MRMLTPGSAAPATGWFMIDRAVRAQKTCERDHHAPRRRPAKGRREITGYHTRWARPEEPADDPERLAIREVLAFGKALFDVRTTLGLSVAELALRASLTEDDIERIEEGGTEPTIPLLRRLAAALNADVHLTAGHHKEDSFCAAGAALALVGLGAQIRSIWRAPSFSVGPW